MQTLGVLVIAVLLLAAPARALAYDRLVNPWHTCSLGGTPEYATLQDAVNAASPGEQIGVCPGTYDQTVVVTTAVTLTAIGSVLIESSSSVGSTCFDVRANRVTVRYFVIEGCETGIQVAAGEALVQNNHFLRNATGIAIAGGGNDAVHNNLFEDNGFGVLLTGRSDGTTVWNNTFRLDGFAIYLSGATGVIVNKNAVQNGLVGIRADLHTSDSTISFNTVSFNKTGIELQGLDATNQIIRNVVTRNTIIDCAFVPDASTPPVFSKNTCGTEDPAGAWD